MITTKERMKKAATRVNKAHAITHLEYESERASEQVRPKNYVHQPVKNPKLVPPRVVEFTGTYDGADLKPFDGRPGAMDFKKCPSKGLST